MASSSFGFDQFLQRPTGELANQIGPIPNAERVEAVRLTADSW